MKTTCGYSTVTDQWRCNEGNGYVDRREPCDECPLAVKMGTMTVRINRSSLVPNDPTPAESQALATSWAYQDDTHPDDVLQYACHLISVARKRMAEREELRNDDNRELRKKIFYYER